MIPKMSDTGDIVKRAHAVGTYYGFAPFSSVALKRRGEGAKAPYPESVKPELLDPVSKEIASFLKSVRDAGLAPASTRPLFLWHTNAAPGRPSPKQVVVQFHILGVDRAIADIVLIRAVRALVGDVAKAETRLRINSMGDKETRARFSRELSSFFRKRAATLPAECLEHARTDVLKAAETLLEHEERSGLPSSTDHLSEASRKHFESVLEYLEATETPYELSPDLLTKAGMFGETCFEIISDENVHAWGSRYHDLSKQFFKSNVPSVGAVVRITTEARDVIPSVKDRTNPRFVFVHIGDEAKRESMKMADMLRKARVPLAQAIGIESLTEQIRFADGLNPRYLIIMGRKEALERSVILRERASHTETFIPLDSLVDRLRAVA
jgi:histidyl-tRNA synthetase